MTATAMTTTTTAAAMTVAKATAAAAFSTESFDSFQGLLSLIFFAGWWNSAGTSERMSRRRRRRRRRHCRMNNFCDVIPHFSFLFFLSSPEPVTLEEFANVRGWPTCIGPSYKTPQRFPKWHFNRVTHFWLPHWAQCHWKYVCQFDKKATYLGWKLIFSTPQWVGWEG